MPQPIETIFVNTSKIACNGDNNSSHPRVYLTMGQDGFVDCPYCGKHYVLKESVDPSEIH